MKFLTNKNCVTYLMNVHVQATLFTCQRAPQMALLGKGRVGRRGGGAAGAQLSTHQVRRASF